jgi:hypothetical protein
VVILSALGTGHLYSSQGYRWYSFRLEVSQPQGPRAVGMIESIKNRLYPFRKGSHDIPAFMAVPQPTAPLPTPLLLVYLSVSFIIIFCIIIFLSYSFISLFSLFALSI